MNHEELVRKKKKTQFQVCKFVCLFNLDGRGGVGGVFFFLLPI